MLRRSPSRENAEDFKYSVQVFPEFLSSSSNELVGAIDQGTSSTRFVTFTRCGQIAALAQMEHTQIYPSSNPGWHEHDPTEIWSNVVTLMEAVAVGLNKFNVHLTSVGITNQRETTVAWNKITGKCYYNAIVWDDTRTSEIAINLAEGNFHRLSKQTGLPLASYFSGTKVKWLLDHVNELRYDLTNIDTSSQVAFGTIDSWLLYQLTGWSCGRKTTNTGGLHYTDVTNASRWLFMDLGSCNWDSKLIDIVCEPHKVPVSALPAICPSSYVYGYVNPNCGLGHALFHDLPIASIIGDQQAALFGQTAFSPGDAKNTYGTGLFLMLNTGTTPVSSTHGLLTTVAYQIGIGGAIHYALEGSVSHAGATIQWLRDQLQIISSADESQTLATSQNDGMYLVPAFSGLFAPHWRSSARACIVGITASHHKGHFVRAALEAAAYQTKEVFEAIIADSSCQLKDLRVDGGMTHNLVLMQFQADVLGVKVVQPLVMETTSAGAAFAAGLAVGVWKDLEEIKELWGVARVFEPAMSAEDQEKNWTGWKKAIRRSWDWVEEDTASANNYGEGDTFENCLCNIPEDRPTFIFTCALPIIAVSVLAAICGFQAGRSISIMQRA